MIIKRFSTWCEGFRCVDIAILRRPLYGSRALDREGAGGGGERSELNAES